MSATKELAGPYVAGVGLYRLCREPAQGEILERAECLGVECALYSNGSFTEWRVLSPVEEVPVEYIEIARAEGLARECITVRLTGGLRKGDGKGGCFHDDWWCSALIEATTEMRLWGRTAPKGGGYDKCDFIVQWKDGTAYVGRFDLQYGGTDGGLDFRESLSHRIRFYAGFAGTPVQYKRKNTVEQYTDEEAQRRYHDMIDGAAGFRDNCRHMLAKCEL